MAFKRRLLTFRSRILGGTRLHVSITSQIIRKQLYWSKFRRIIPKGKNMDPPSPPSKTEILDAPLHLIGFEIDELSAQRVSGHLLLSPKCCQPFRVLHGGVSALIAEALASMGANIASGFNRVAGIHLSINHLKTAVVGDFIVAEATPVTVGKSIQVWDVRLSKCDPSDFEIKTLIASSRVTLFCKLPIPESSRDVAQNLKKYAKL